MRTSGAPLAASLLLSALPALLAAAAQPGGSSASSPAPATQPPAMAQNYSGGGVWNEDPQRREAVALKALVELLVQKGVISLDEYLARLKR